MVSDLADNLKYPLLLASLLIGPLELFAGEKMFSVTIFILGFLGTFLFTSFLFFLFLIDANSSWTKFYILVVICVILSILVGLILAKLSYLGIIVCGTLGGMFFGVFFHSTILSQINSNPSEVKLKAFFL